MVASVPDVVPLSMGAIVMLSLEKEATASEKSSVTVALSPALSAVSERVKELTEGAVVSTVNDVIESVLLTLLELSVTVMVQLS
jgi:hypothetical protein